MSDSSCYSLDPEFAARIGKDSNKFLSAISGLEDKLPLLQIGIGLCTKGVYFDVSCNQMLIDFRSKACAETDAFIASVSDMCEGAAGIYASDQLMKAALAALGKAADTNG